MNRIKLHACLMLACAIIAGQTIRIGAYATSAYKWASWPVPFYVNPANADVSTSAATSAVQTGMDVWNTQAGTAFRFSYAGEVRDTSTAVDGRNVIIFRNTSNSDSPGAIATTYTWISNGSRYDSDIVFWDGAYHFFTGFSGCANTNGQYGVYIEDVASHELGHALGLAHSSYSDATMYGTYTACSTSFRVLSSDDIAGARALYPSSSSSSTTTNTTPTVSITGPGSGTSIVQGAALTFSGSASDAEDGSLTSKLAWTSSIDGLLGTGSGFSKILSAGSHVITAKVTDSDGSSASSQVSVTVTSSTPTSTSGTSPSTSETPSSTTSGPMLTARGYKVKGLQKADLAWSNLTATSVDIYRDGDKIMTTTTEPDTATDNIDQRGGGSYTYQVCGTGTSTCSNRATVKF